MRLRFAMACLAVLLAGCQALRPALPVPRPAQQAAAEAMPGGLAVSGRVDFGGSRSVQATSAEVVGAATVSFIDTATNTTVATGKTDAGGAFMLQLADYSPQEGETYLLEAVKGLRGHAPGAPAARLRTVLKWSGSGWLSCTNAASDGPIVINALTTALAIVSALDRDGVPPTSTTGKVNAAVNPAVLNQDPAYSSHPDGEISQLATDLLAYLGADADPVAAAGAIRPSITGITPASGAAGSLVKLSGAGFSPVPGGNAVTLGGAIAQVILATPASLVAIVPGGAGSGAIAVRTSRGQASFATPFAVVPDAVSVSVTAFSPAEGVPGSPVTLAGDFGAATGSVSLGGVRAKVAAWSRDAVQVTVPFGAASAAWTVRSGASAATSADRFKIRTGADLGPFRYAYDTQNFPYGNLYAETSLAIGNWVYLIGGSPQNNGYRTKEIWRAPIRSDGSIGAFRRAGTSLAQETHAAATVRIGDWLYVIAGWNRREVQRAHIEPDGTLGPFEIHGYLNTAREGHSAAAVNGYLYVFGGAWYDTIERAKIQADGYSLGPFEQLSTKLYGGGRGYAACFVSGNRVYLLGGYSGSYFRGDILVVTIGPDGSLAGQDYNRDGQGNQVDMTRPRHAAGAFTYNGAIYVVGGEDNGTILSSVERFTIRPDGNLSPGTVLSASLLQKRYVISPVVTGDHLYVWGGNDPGGAGFLQHMEVAEFNSDGTLQPFRRVGGNLGTWGQAAVLVGDNIYKIGGGMSGNVVKTVEQATIHPGGGISPWRQTGDLNVARMYHNAVRVKDFLYVLGGCLAYNNVSGHVVERAQIGADGSLGAFSIMPQALVLPRCAPSSEVVGDYLYVTGGSNSSGTLRDVERAKIDADGSIGAFEIYGGTRMLQARGNHGFLTMGDWAYVFGGYQPDIGGFLNSVEQARVGPDGSLGPFAAAPALPRTAHGLESGGFRALGSYMYLFGAFDGSNPWGSLLRAPIGAGGSLGAWETTSVALNSARWHQSVIVGDDAVYVIGGNCGPPCGWNGEDRVEVAPWR